MSDETTEELARLFEAARREQPRSVARTQTVQRMLEAKAAPAASRRLVPWLLVAAALGLVFSAFLAHTGAPPIGAERFFRSTAHADAAIETKAVTPLTPAPDLPKNPEARAALPAPSEKVRPKEAPSAALPLTLEEETNALEGVENDLRAGNATAALAALDRYARAARGGHMQAEAELLRIQALASLGRVDAADALAQKFVSAYPNSPLVDRARKYLFLSGAGGRQSSGDNGR